MKNFIKIILLIGISSLLLIGCSSAKQETTIDNFINKLVSAKTYENITSYDAEKFIDESREIFQEYLTEDAFNTLAVNRTPYIYYSVINKNNINETTNVEIVKTKETKNDEYTHYEYEVSYKLKSSDSSIDMTDYIVFKVMKDDASVIDEVYVSDKTSSIFSEYKTIVQ